MSRIQKLLAAPLFVILLAGLCFSADTPSTKDTTKETAKDTTKESSKTAPAKKKSTTTKKPKVQKFVGNVSAVDTKTGSGSVKGTAGEKNFITQDAAKDALERLTVGDRVRVQYTEKDGKLTTSSVRRLKLPQTKTKPTEESAKSKSTKAPDQQKQLKDAVK